MVRPLTSAVIAASAFLVFWIQPLVAGMLLPLLGGAPAVWNTAVLFFQGMLLLGYLYAHGLARLPMRTQLPVHGIFFLVAALALPGDTAGWGTPPRDMVIGWLLGNLALYIALPYVFLASTAPLLQHWYGRSAARGSNDPYFLYAASNLGSFSALLAFPLLLERYFPLSGQVVAWQRVFLGLGVGLVAVGYLIRKGSPVATRVMAEETRPARLRDVLRWLVLAFLPSSLMLGVTTHITMDIAAVSFFWVAPLALYLATFVVAFSTRGQRAARACRFVLPVALAATLLITLRDGISALELIPLELVAFTCISMVLHFRLYEARPPVARLTSFYLWVALGGLLGGVLNGLLAPILFKSILEYPLVLAAALAIVEWPVIRKARTLLRSGSWHGLRAWEIAAVGAAVVFVAASVTDAWMPDVLMATALVLVSALAGAYAIGAGTGGRLVTVVCYLTVLLSSNVIGSNREIFADRSFFGAISVLEENRAGVDVRTFSHGTTIHGLQAKEAGLSLTIQSYYAGVAPHLQRFLASRGPATIGITGLGTGNLACLGDSEDRVTFFEIDPAVESVAREYFSFLDQCPPQTDVILGDARLQLAKVDSARFDLLVLDAFSSDAIPVHLLTNEAAQEYERVLAPDGLMAFHISNRYLDLKPVLGRLASHRGWSAWLVKTVPGPDEPLAEPSEFVLVTRHEPTGRWLDDTAAIGRLPEAPGFRLWTDDYSNVLGILRW